MRIRIFSPFFPYPKNEGAFITIAEQSIRLSELGHAVELFYWKGQDPPQHVLNDLFQAIKIRRIAGQKKETRRLARILKSLFSRWSSAEIYHYPPPLKKACEAILKDECDLELFQYSFAAPWLQDLKKTKAKRVVIFHNRESILYQKAAQASTGLKKALLSLNALKLAKHEKFLAESCDEIWFNSDFDLKTYSFGKKSLSTPLRLFPPFFSLNYFQDQKRVLPKDLVSVLGFVGGLHFRPNHLSAMWILEKLAPELEKRKFQGRLMIIGKNPSPELVRLAKKYAFVQILGFVKDLTEYWSEVTFSLSPHLEGSGIRMKLLESVVKGVPVLTHHDALSQLSEELRDHPLVFARNTAQEWAEILLSPLTLKKESASHQAALLNPPSWFSHLHPGVNL